MAKTIIDSLNDIKKSYYEDKIAIFEGLSFSQYATLKQVEHYTNSKYLTGQKDSLGRDKPFYNIVNAKVNFAITATDLDTKDVQIMAENPGAFDKSFLIRREAHNWMKETNFALTLNQIGETRARYGGVLVKKVMKDNELFLEIPEWKNVITDQVDIEKGAKIEKHYMTPSEVLEKLPYWNKNISEDDVLKMASNVRRLNLYKTTKTPTKYIVVWEIHGEFPESYIDGTGSEKKYSNQYHIVLGDTEKKQIHAHAEIEKESPYKYLAWRKIPGRALGAGVVEDGFEAQIWTNDAKQKEKEVMELASKVMFKTTDPKFQNNILTDVDNGAILKISPGSDVAQLNTVSSSVPEFANLVNSWNVQYEKVSSTFETNTGDNLPSGTPFRLAVIQAQNANSLFSYRRQEMGIFIRELFMDWIIPHLVKKINKEHILSAEFSQEELKKIDDSFATKYANDKFIEQLLTDNRVNQQTYDKMFQLNKDFIQETGSRRFLDIPKDYFKDIKLKVDVVTTGEQMNKAATLESLSNIMSVVAKNPTILDNPILSQIFGRIIEITNVGLSPISLGLGMEKTQQNTQNIPQTNQQMQPMFQQQLEAKQPQNG